MKWLNEGIFASESEFCMKLEATVARDRIFSVHLRHKGKVSSFEIGVQNLFLASK